MPRQKSLLTVIRDLVQQEVGTALESILGSLNPGKPTKRGRRRKRGGKWRPGGPGRPPKAVAAAASRARKK